MARNRRKFSSQFKAEAVQFVIETGRSVAEIARELEINEGTLGNWVNEWKKNNPEPDKALTPMERARVAEMEAEMRRLRMENEFLKKAALDSTGHRNTSGFLWCCGGCDGSGGSSGFECGWQGGDVGAVEEWGVDQRDRASAGQGSWVDLRHAS